MKILSKNINKKAFLTISIIVVFLMLIIIGKGMFRIAQTDYLEGEKKVFSIYKNYEQFTEEDENVEGTDNVKFGAFFLKDIDGDGYTEKMNGSCITIGKNDTLYMEIKVNTEGYLTNGKIEIAGKNFFYETNLIQDNVIA